jgi:hypothetical protein
MLAGTLAKWFYEPAGILDTVVVENRSAET